MPVNARYLRPRSSRTAGARLEGRLRQFEFDERRTRYDETKPPHSVEFVQLAAARLHGELTYTNALRERISTGAYAFADEAAR